MDDEGIELDPLGISVPVLSETIKIPVEISPVNKKMRRRRSARNKALLSDNGISRSRSNTSIVDLSTAMKQNQPTSLWDGFNEAVDDPSTPNDDFICIPKNKGESLLPITPRNYNHRKSSVVVVPSAPSKDNDYCDDDFRPDFSSLVKYDFIESTPIDGIYQALNASMICEKNGLNDYTIDKAKETELMYDVIYDLHDMHRRGIEQIRKEGVLRVLYHKFKIKLLMKLIRRGQDNIKMIDAFQTYVSKLKLRKGQFPIIDYNSFITNYLTNNHDLKDLQTKIKRLRAAYKPLKEVEIDPKDIEGTLLSPKNRSGRIIIRLEQSMDEMTYGDLELIMNAITPSTELLTRTRRLLFDISWQQYLFPFSRVEQMILPNIFDLSPSIFKTPYLTKKVLHTPFNVLNAGDWPFKHVSMSLFFLMLQTDPFRIADLFWDLITYTSKIVAQILTKQGKKKEDIDIGFDQLFAVLLVCVFAFGVSEILEVMMFSSSFLEYVDNNTHQQYAMTHFQGIIQFVRNIDANEYHRRFGETKISIFD